MPLSRLAGFFRCRSGATAVEFGMILLPLLLLVIGTMEFGRAFFIRNGLSYAADVAARDIMIGKVPAAATDTEAKAILEPKVVAAFDPGNPDLVQFDVGRVTVDGATYRVLTVSYPFNLVTPGLFDAPLRLDTTRRVPAGQS